MPAHVIIQDGPAPYWWTSPDIWVVPGSDPNGTPGQPTVGLPAYLWARVSNAGPSSATGVRIDFYWADPTAQVAVGVATKIGSAFVDLAPGALQDVLCLTPWVPVLVNSGHECLIAVAHAQNDLNSLPDPLPMGFSLDPPAHEQIAQTNISVLDASMLSATRMIKVHAKPRHDKVVQLAAEFAGPLAQDTSRRLGLDQLHPAKEKLVAIGLSRRAQCGDDTTGKATLDVKLRGGASVPVYVGLDAKKLPRGQYQVIHIIEREQEKILGGVTYIIVNADKEVKS